MKIDSSLLERHANEISGVLECFDRVILTGTYRAIGWPQAMMAYLGARQVRMADFAATLANGWRKEMAAHIHQRARTEGVEVRQVQASECKEEIVQGILAQRGRRPGVVCVLGAMERCRSFQLRHHAQNGWASLDWGPGKCQHFYIYFID